MKWVKKMIMILLVIIILILQLTIFSYHPVYNLKPDLFLIFAINIALLTGPKMGVSVGFIMGMLQDLFLGGMFGIFTITKTVLCGLIGFGEGHFYKKNIFIPSLTIFIFTVIHEFLIVFLSEELILNINYYDAFLSRVLPLAVYNTILGVVIYFILYKIFINRGKLYE